MKIVRLLWLYLISMVASTALYPAITFYDESSAIQIASGGVFDNSGSFTISTGALIGDRTGVTGTRPIWFDYGIYALYDTEFNDRPQAMFVGALDQRQSSYRIKLPANSGMIDQPLFRGLVQDMFYDQIDVNAGSNSPSVEGLLSFNDHYSNALRVHPAVNPLSINLLGGLNQNILLDLATPTPIVLDADLMLGLGVTVSGVGQLNFNGYNMILGLDDLVWTSTLYFQNSGQVILNSLNNLYGEWILNGADAADVLISGNANTLDFRGGIIHVSSTNANRAQLAFQNVTFTGTHNGIRQGSFVVSNFSKVYLSNVILYLDEDITWRTGQFIATGPVRIVTGDHLLTFDQACSLTVDGTTVEYDTLDNNDNNNIRFGSALGNSAFLNGGSIRKARSLKLGDFIFNQTKALDTEYFVSDLRRLEVTSTATIDGAGFSFQFARNPQIPIFLVSAGTTACFTNALMKDLPVQNNSLSPGLHSHLIFGDGTQIGIGGSGILDDTWFFQGQTVLDGQGKIVQLGAGLIVVLPGSSLLLDNITIRGVQGTNIRCMDNTCTISFGNVIFELADSCSFNNGRFDVIGTWDIVGSSTFIYASSMTSTITNFGTISMDKGTTFSYDPPVANRDLIIMDTANSTFELNNATLASTRTGLRLTKGTLIIEGACSVINDGAVSESQAVSLGDGKPAHDLTIKFGPSATLSALTGLLLYDNVE